MRCVERIETLSESEIEDYNERGWSIVQVIKIEETDAPTLPFGKCIEYVCLIRKTIY